MWFALEVILALVIIVIVSLHWKKHRPSKEKPKAETSEPDRNKRKHRWILTLPGIPGHCVANLRLPSEMAPVRSSNKRSAGVLGTKRVFGTMEVEFYDVWPGPDDRFVDKQPLIAVREWLDAPMSRRAEVKFLDASGTVQEMVTMDVKPAKLTFPRLSYSTDGLFTATLELTVLKVETRAVYAEKVDS